MQKHVRGNVYASKDQKLSLFKPEEYNLWNTILWPWAASPQKATPGVQKKIKCDLLRN